MSFRNRDLTLRGFLHRPEGSGPFPAIVWNHGSESDPGSGDDLAEFYGSRGYVFFVPHRHGHGRSPGEYPLREAEARLRADARNGGLDRDRVISSVIELQERYLDDTFAAASWLERQDFVDADRMVMSGVSHGGIQSVLAAEADAGMQAYIPFGPGAMAWEGSPRLHHRLLQAVRNAPAPIFLLQAANDYSLGPSEVLGAELERKGEPNQARVYPPYGDTAQSGHGEFACRGTEVWGKDVGVFLDRVVGPRRDG